MNELFEAFKKRYNQIHQAYWTGTLSDAALATCWHQDQLREVVGHLKRPSPFYQRHLHAVDEHTLSLDSLASLDSIHFSLRPGQASPAQPSRSHSATTAGFAAGLSSAVAQSRQHRICQPIQYQAA